MPARPVKGKNINGLISLQPDETVKAFLPVKEFVEDKYIVMVTKPGRDQEVRTVRVRQSDVARHYRRSHSTKAMN